MLARYSHIPLGNIGRDWELEALDTLFARSLRDAGHLLWTSDPLLPDVAGGTDLVADAQEELRWKAEQRTEVGASCLQKSNRPERSSLPFCAHSGWTLPEGLTGGPENSDSSLI